MKNILNKLNIKSITALVILAILLLGAVLLILGKGNLEASEMLVMFILGYICPQPNGSK